MEQVELCLWYSRLRRRSGVLHIIINRGAMIDILRRIVNDVSSIKGEHSYRICLKVLPFGKRLWRKDWIASFSPRHDVMLLLRRTIWVVGLEHI